ncbi:hypothetical protein [Pyruvatibacter sp.]|uniref:hypothetical protein n=1 Tax=Pyruvatibacter sp. TaxID=1981328 RepID=UPI0032EEC15C
MTMLNPFARRTQAPVHPATGDPAKDMTQVLLRIEAQLVELNDRSRALEKLERRLLGIETAIKHI